MAGVEIGGLELRHAVRIDAAGGHEVERLADPAALRAVAERGRSKAVRQAAKAKLTTLGATLEAPREAKEPKQKKSDPAAEARLKK
ncbi:hypothetical protein, partial [Bosea sp. (in: a-proteobacteria)]|uniref:hypothetical protein n=1 Tax=Bosea sp. (in: a-proteobacteria) TaxID=1871050 RepID=UPI0031FF451D